MKRTPSNLVFHELIGLRVHIMRHYDPTLVCREGEVVWETPRTLHVRVGDSVILVLKEGGLFEFTLPDGRRVRVRGDHLLGSPGERAKRIVRGR